MRTQAARARCVLKAEYFEEDGQFELFPWAELPFEHVASADRFLVPSTILHNTETFNKQKKGRLEHACLICKKYYN